MIKIIYQHVAEEFARECLDQRCEKNIVAANDAVLKKLLARERNRSLKKNKKKKTTSLKCPHTGILRAPFQSMTKTQKEDRKIINNGHN